MMNKKELSELIKTSEGYNLEFKETLNSSIVKEICAFANASGGRIIFNPIIMDLSLTVDDLMKGSYPHNMFLFSNLERIDLVEKAGSGFLRIKKAMGKYELPMANIYFSKRLFEVTFQRPDLQINSYKRRVIDGKGFEYARKDLQKGLDRDLQKDLKKLNKNQKIIVAEIQKDNFITQKELSKIVGITEKNVRNNIAKLKNLNIIKRVGPVKGGHWEAIK